jgi:excisionase family DNA binding protein
MSQSQSPSSAQAMPEAARARLLANAVARKTRKPMQAPVEPLAVAPRVAADLLSLGLSRIYQLMQRGELPSYREGTLRRIPMAAIHARIEAKLADTAGWEQKRNETPLMRRRKQQTRKGASTMRCHRSPSSIASNGSPASTLAVLDQLRLFLGVVDRVKAVRVFISARFA